MSTQPLWSLTRRDEPGNRQIRPEPAREEPNLAERVGNFFRSIPEWFNNQWNRLSQFFRPNPGVNLNGVDRRLVHIACAIGIGSHTNCVCTDAQRSRNAGYGARNSEHLRGNAIDLRLSSVPGRTNREREQFVADVATVLGYGGPNERDRVFASVHGGTGPHLHFQFGSNNIAHLNPVPSSRGGQADLIAAQQRIAGLVGQDGLQRIMQTRAPDELTQNPINRYSGYQQQHPPQGPRLVYSQAGPQPHTPRPRIDEDRPRPTLWTLNARPQA